MAMNRRWMKHGQRYVGRLAGFSMGIGIVTGLVGCGAIQDDFKAVFIDPFTMPTPSEAAAWMFSVDPERRRLGMMLISNAPFGGEEPYLRVYREAVTDVDPMVRAAAAHGLAMHGEVEDGQRLIELLADKSQMVRWEATKGLQRIHDRNAIEPLLIVLAQDLDADTRAAAAAALGQYADSRVLDGLIDAIDDESLTVNHEAARSLRTLTGEFHRYDTLAWESWQARATTPFANGSAYIYPTYFRKRLWYEKVFPFSRRQFEQPKSPVGYAFGQEEADPARESNDSNKAAETG